jgi:uncharacterized membrane protein
MIRKEDNVMGELSLVVVTTDSKDGALRAFDAAKELDRDGWIEIVDYELLRKDEKGHLTAREMDDERSEKMAAAAVGVAGGVIGATLSGPAGAAAGVATGALAGAGSIQLMERLVRDRSLEPDSLGKNCSVLAVIVEDRHAERLDEELQKLGRTARRRLNRAECEVEFDAYLRRSKEKIRSIQDNIQAQLLKAASARGEEKIRIEADVAAKRAQLEAAREKLKDRIQAMNSGVRSEIREINFRLESAGLSARSGIATGADQLHRRLNHFSDALETLIQDRLDMLKEDASELKARASKTSGETKAAIEDHLLAVELDLREERGILRDSFEDRLLQMQEWFENLGVQSALARAEVRDRLKASIKAAQHALAELKAHIRMRNREDERAWKDIRQGLNKAWKDLEDAFDRANRERV